MDAGVTTGEVRDRGEGSVGVGPEGLTLPAVPEAGLAGSQPLPVQSWTSCTGNAAYGSQEPMTQGVE